jgi:hypothetical protein
MGGRLGEEADEGSEAADEVSIQKVLRRQVAVARALPSGSLL